MTPQHRIVRVAAMSVAAVTLAACEPALGPEELSFDPLQGEWTACLNDGAGDYTKQMLFFADGSFRLTTTTFATTDRSCSGAETSVAHAPLSYRLLGEALTRIGPDGREVVGRQMNIEDTQTRVFTIVYVDSQSTPQVLYFGDLALNPTLDGTAPEKRPDVLSTSSALTSR